MWENNSDTLQFSADTFFHHEQVVLAAGTCDGFLPMRFLRSGSHLIVRYSFSGYLPLSSFRIERTEDVLYLMEKTLLILHICPEYLLSPERILLRTNTIFYNRARDDLRIAFVPRAGAFLSGGSNALLPGSADSPLPGGSADMTIGPAPPAGVSDSMSAYAFHRELLLFLLQLKQDLRDPYAGFLRRLAEDLAYNCRDTADMLRRIGLLRRELEDTAGRQPRSR